MAKRVVQPETFLSVVLDESGSMLATKHQTLEGFNALITKNKAVPGKVFVTLTKFNSLTPMNVVYAGKPIGEVPPLTSADYQPDAYTPLWDAVGRSILTTDEARARATRKPTVLFVIITDGLENASREYTAERVREMVARRKAEEWGFVFIGANIDAWGIGQYIGTQIQANYEATPVGTQSLWSSLGDATVIYRKSGGSLQELCAAIPNAAYTPS